MNEISYHRTISVSGDYDLVVCGAGPAGCAAAIAARRQGLKTLLIEANGQLGGMGTSGLVSHWLGGRNFDCRRWVVGGLFREFSQEAAQQGIALIPEGTAPDTFSPHGWKYELNHGIPFDPFEMAHYLDRKTAADSVEVLLGTRVVDVRVADDKIAHVIAHNKSGLFALGTKAVVDATGDADIAAVSGCQVQTGRPGDGLMTPATLMFHVYNVDQDALSIYIHENNASRFREEIKNLRAAGKWPFPVDIFISVQLTEKGVMMVNTSRLCGIDGTDGESVSRGYQLGRKEIYELFAVMKRQIPGFHNARIKAVATTLGIRETRRIIGDFRLSVQDLVDGRGFPDIIGLSSYEWDLPDPLKPSIQPMRREDTRMKRSLRGIPYRVMVPRPVRNLICPGRAVSVDRDVLGPIRVAAPCMAMGQAAGIAAEQVVRSGKPFSQIDMGELRSELLKGGAIVDPIEGP